MRMKNPFNKKKRGGGIYTSTAANHITINLKKNLIHYHYREDSQKQ